MAFTPGRPGVRLLCTVPGVGITRGMRAILKLLGMTQAEASCRETGASGRACLLHKCHLKPCSEDRQAAIPLQGRAGLHEGHPTAVAAGESGWTFTLTPRELPAKKRGSVGSL